MTTSGGELMRFVTFRHQGEERLGALVGAEQVLDLPRAGALAVELGLAQRPQLFGQDMLAFLAGGCAPVLSAQLLLDGLAGAEGAARAERLRGEAALLPLSAVQLLAPIPRPRKNVFCLGLNYADHAAESSKFIKREPKLPQYPIFFTKAATAVIGPDVDIPWDTLATKELDYEAELGVVIGQRGKNIPKEQAYDYIFGYTLVNDISARDLQRRHGQWFKGKTLDGTCPLGPHIVHKSAVPDPMQLEIMSRVNGEERQHSNTSRMLFDIPTIIEQLSLGLTLEPGDVIATGTPEGVGFAREPQGLLQDGDIVEVEVASVGVLRNRVRVVAG
jgi:2-keto-4-pentenoate hydratase/2-oxohepta-3-ene-1,7-dioic acid hydratase in catechol pathway